MSVGWRKLFNVKNGESIISSFRLFLRNAATKLAYLCDCCPCDEKGWSVLRYELESFVCQGEYELGLERILSSFLRGLDAPVQPAAWVSGFYGSGKSHLAKMLRTLWTDHIFADGAAARSGFPMLAGSTRDRHARQRHHSRHRLLGRFRPAL